MGQLRERYSRLSVTPGVNGAVGTGEALSGTPLAGLPAWPPLLVPRAKSLGCEWVPSS